MVFRDDNVALQGMVLLWGTFLGLRVVESQPVPLAREVITSDADVVARIVRSSTKGHTNKPIRQEL
jgi:hypothetical protein